MNKENPKYCLLPHVIVSLCERPLLIWEDMSFLILISTLLVSPRKHGIHKYTSPDEKLLAWYSENIT